MEDIVPIYTKYVGYWRKLYNSNDTLQLEIEKYYKITEDFEKGLTFKIINIILEQECNSALYIYCLKHFKKTNNSFIKFLTNNFDKLTPKSQKYILNTFEKHIKAMNANELNKIVNIYKKNADLCDQRHGLFNKNGYYKIASLYKEAIMKKNVGGLDKILRIIVGLGLVGAALFTNNYWLFLGIIPLGTGLLGFCPLYSILGINTCSNPKSLEQK